MSKLTLMNYQEISKCLAQCDEHINEGGGKITSVVLAGFNLPDNIKNFIKQDYKTVKKIVDFYYQDFSIKSAGRSNTNIDFITNKTNNKKTKIIEFNNEIFCWLKSINFFDNNQKISQQDKSVFIYDLTWCRKNQKISIEKSIENNFISGIDLQCTGAGKTYIILSKAHYFSQINNQNVLLFCERKYILENEFSPNKEIDKRIFDKSKTNIINLVTDSDKKFYKNIKGNNNLIIVNRAFLSSNNRYQKITKDLNIGLILVDECQSSTAQKTFEILEYLKSLNTKLIGFSASPIVKKRFGNYSLLYGLNGQINYLSNYSIFNAIIDDPPVCLPFKINLYDLKDKNPNFLLELINDYLPILPYKKIIVWFRKTEDCDIYFKKFNGKLKDIKVFISHNKIGSTNDSEFINMEKNCIMLCVNRFREGTNMNTLDLGIMLDADIERGEIPTIQMCGRLLRFDKNQFKKYGLVVDFSSKSQIIEKIIKYYCDILNSDIDENLITYIKNNIIVNKKDKQLIFNLNKTKNIIIQFKTLEINWDTIKNEAIQWIENLFAFNIYLVPISNNVIINNNFKKTVCNKVQVRNTKTFVWGCKEDLNKNIKTNDVVMFHNNINEEIKFYRVSETFVDSTVGELLWNDSLYSRIFTLNYINQNKISRKNLFEMIGYKENYVPRTTTQIKSLSKNNLNTFKNWLNSNIQPDYYSDDSENCLILESNINTELESDTESNDETEEIEIKGKTYILEGAKVYEKTKKCTKGEQYGALNAKALTTALRTYANGKVKKLPAPKEIEV